MRSIAQYVGNSSERFALNYGPKTYHPTLHNRKKKRKGQLPMRAMVYFTTLSETLQFDHPVDKIVPT